MQIQVYNDWDHVPKALEQGTDQVVLAWDGEYRKGDVIEFDGLEPGHFYVVRADAALDEALVYVTCETILYPVPFYEKKTSYNPLCFFDSYFGFSFIVASFNKYSYPKCRNYDSYYCKNCHKGAQVFIFYHLDLPSF